MTSPEVESKGGPGKNLDSVTHHRHFVKGGLPVENDKVVVPQMTLDLVTKLKVKIAWFRVITEVDSLPVVPDDVLCTRVLVVATGNQLLHSVQCNDARFSDTQKISIVQ